MLCESVGPIYARPLICGQAFVVLEGDADVTGRKDDELWQLDVVELRSPNLKEICTEESVELNGFEAGIRALGVSSPADTCK